MKYKNISPEQLAYIKAKAVLVAIEARPDLDVEDPAYIAACNDYREASENLFSWGAPIYLERTPESYKPTVARWIEEAQGPRRNYADWRAFLGLLLKLPA